MPKQFQLLQSNDLERDGYWVWPVEFSAPAAEVGNPSPRKTRYDVVFPLTVDVLVGYLDVTAAMAADKDQIVAKGLAGQVGTIIADAAQGATQIVVRSTPAVWNRQFFTGYFVSFGVETLWAGSPGEAGRVVPEADPDLAEYLVTAISVADVVVDGAVVAQDATMTLWTPLAAPVTAGTNVNAVKKYMPIPKSLPSEGVVDFGKDSFKGAELKAGQVLRIEYFNKAAAGSGLSRNVFGDLRLAY
jgi:hypothetical protein